MSDIEHVLVSPGDFTARRLDTLTDVERAELEAKGWRVMSVDELVEAGVPSIEQGAIESVAKRSAERN